MKLLKEHQIEIVISAMGGEKILDQLSLVEAIHSAGTVKVPTLLLTFTKEAKELLVHIFGLFCGWQRFLPSEFGHDVDRADPVEPGLTMYKEKRQVRRLIEKLEIPYTYICCNSIASWPYHNNRHPSEVIPPLDHFEIYGDGSVRGNYTSLLPLDHLSL